MSTLQSKQDSCYVRMGHEVSYDLTVLTCFSYCLYRLQIEQSGVVAEDNLISNVSQWPSASCCIAEFSCGEVCGQCFESVNSICAARSL
jgi:hypothetical protein